MAQELEVTGLKPVLRELRKYDKYARTTLRNKLRTATAEDRSKIKRVIQEARPLLKSARNTGFFHSGRSAWNGANVDIDSLGGKNVVIAIKATGRAKKFGFDYAELAGVNMPARGHVSRDFARSNSKTYRTRQNGQAAGFLNMLNNHLPATHTPKPGRYAFQAIVRRMPYIQKKVIKILEDLNAELTYNIATKDY